LNLTKLYTANESEESPLHLNNHFFAVVVFVTITFFKLVLLTVEEVELPVDLTKKRWMVEPVLKA
jgi:hypothetical protein